MVPVHPSEAVQVVVPDETQVREVVLPEFTVVGVAINVNVGAAFTVTVTLCVTVPPGPVQLKK